MNRKNNKVQEPREQIQEMIDRETEAWETQNVEKLLSLFHEDFVWVWPPTNQDHDPITWESPLGKFDEVRWRGFYATFFATQKLVHNQREIKSIKLTSEGNGAFAVVDIDTLWKDKKGKTTHWLGRVCKVYSLIQDKWKLIMHTGVLDY